MATQSPRQQEAVYILDGIGQLVTGSAGALARNTSRARQFFTSVGLFQQSCSRFALNAGEGARVPSNEFLPKTQIDSRRTRGV
jgi:hypothetical protein